MGYLFLALPVHNEAHLAPLVASACTYDLQPLGASVANDSCVGQLCYVENLSSPALKQLQEEGAAVGADVLYAPRFVHLSRPGAIIMDMDMTSVTIEGIDEIARSLGVYEEVAAITSMAMHGKADFATSLTRRVALLQGGSASVLEEVKARMHETPGLNCLLTTLKAHGFKCAIASGGFTQLISVLEHKYQLDLVRANTLEIVDGKFTGKVVGPIIDAKGKAQALADLQARFNIAPEQTIALGDGANDLLMIEAASLGIAYHAKPKVVAQAPHALTYCDLSAVALLLETYAREVQDTA